MDDFFNTLLDRLETKSQFHEASAELIKRIHDHPDLIAKLLSEKPSVVEEIIFLLITLMAEEMIKEVTLRSDKLHTTLYLLNHFALMNSLQNVMVSIGILPALIKLFQTRFISYYELTEGLYNPSGDGTTDNPIINQLQLTLNNVTLLLKHLLLYIDDTHEHLKGPIRELIIKMHKDQSFSGHEFHDDPSNLLRRMLAPIINTAHYSLVGTGTKDAAGTPFVFAKDTIDAVLEATRHLPAETDMALMPRPLA